MDKGERGVRPGLGAELREIGEADSMIDGVGRPRTAAAELDHRETDGAHVDGRNHAAAPRRRFDEDFRGWQYGAGAGEKVMRAAKGRDHALEALRRCA